MTYNEYVENLNGKQPILEFESKDYVYIEFDEKTQKLMYGGCCNVGFCKDGEIDYDNDLSFESNLQKLYDKIIEENPNFLEEE